MHPGRVPILVNDYERAVDAELTKVVHGHGRRVHRKTRMIDLLPRERLSPADLSFATRAHFELDATDKADIWLSFSDDPEE